MEGQSLAVIALSFLSQFHVGLSAELSQVSPDPASAFEGSNVLFKWSLPKGVTSQSDFKDLVFGVWRNGYLATYITTVTKAGRIIPNPNLKLEASQFRGRVQWKGDLSQSLAAFEISNINSRDQMDYGLVLNFGVFEESLSDFVSLKVKERTSTITAESSTHNSITPGENASFHCDFHVDDKDKPVFEGVIVGLWARGGISLTLLSLTREDKVITNPDLNHEGPEYLQRVHGQFGRVNNTSNLTRLSFVLKNVRKSDEGVYGCSMDFGPFREPIVSSVKIDVKDQLSSNAGSNVGDNPVQKSFKVHVGKNIMIPCPVLSEVIHTDGTFEGMRWSYCESKNCTMPDTDWSWIAGMNQQGTIKVAQKGPYAKRVNLSQNGTLEIHKVRASDATDYRCTVQRINNTSPRVYFATLEVDTTVRPNITKKSKDRVTVVEGNTLYLMCEVEGSPEPCVVWDKNGMILQNSTKDTNFIRHHAKRELEGRYKCQATNSAGSVSYMVDVTVKGTDDKDDKGLTTLEIVLIAGVCIIGVLGLGAGFLYCKKRKQRLYNSVPSQHNGTSI